MLGCLTEDKSKAIMSEYSDLPRELLVEILVRLPIEDVVKSTAVCKSLCTTDSLFSALFSERVVENYSLCFDNEDVDEYKQLHLPNNVESVSVCFRVAGSINGLVCLVDDMRSYVDNFFLWNPIIKKVVRVPEPGVTSSSHGPFNAFTGFGFDFKTNDYKLLRFVELDRKEPKVEVEIYSLNANCWTSITHIAPKYGLCLTTPRTYGNSFVNGAIHMLAFDRKSGRGRNLILAFDVSEEEVSREIPLPECLSNGYMKLMSTELLKYGQSIAAMTWDWDGMDGNKKVKQIHLWVMKEYGVAMSWTKVFTEVAQLVPRVLFFRQHKERVFVTLDGGLIASLDYKKKHVEVFGDKSVESLRGYPVVDGFVESLVLLDKANA
ncbi:hypothetical protein COLO4_14880 [Corchorus olitorius]|uniref:F-box domain-containing protein n=1 Tax=Corchorus olitorius TaxID=93759 RepID=A0A1R3JQH9_9ROSI|nr:hypothetical protein COLO4_14880 [Corchorus olitorius]